MPLRLPPPLLPGREEPLGALARDGGVNFAVFSQHAQRVEVCVFDANGATELRRYALCGPHDGVWSGFLPGAGPGLVYGLRAHGPYAPEQGHRYAIGCDTAEGVMDESSRSADNSVVVENWPSLTLTT